MIEPYGSHPLQTIKVFYHNPEYTRSIVFIHGGAWRDPGNTFDDFDSMAKYFESRSKSNLFGINYRLSPEFKHPAHIDDVWSAIQHISLKYPGNISLVGHSVGATLSLQLLNATAIAQQSGKVPLELQSLFLLDGIYNIPELVQEYKDYESFVSEAFNSSESYTEAIQTSWSIKEPYEISPKKFIVIHSLQDELLSLNQTRSVQHYFESIKVDHSIITGNYGAHEEVYKNAQVFNIILAALG